MKSITNRNQLQRKLKGKNESKFPTIDTSIIFLNKARACKKLLSNSIEIQKKNKKNQCPKEEAQRNSFLNKELPIIKETKCSPIKYFSTSTNHPHKLYLKYPQKNNRKLKNNVNSNSISPNHTSMSRNNNMNSLMPDKSQRSIHFRLTNGLDALSPCNASRRRSYYLNKNPSKVIENYLNIPHVDYVYSTSKIDQSIIGGTLAGNTDNGLSKSNQDSYFISRNNQDNYLYNIYGVMDGHGVNGKLVSEYIANKAKEYFGSYIIEKAISKSKNCFEILTYNHNAAITTFCTKIQDSLLQGKFDIHYSGSTCIIVFQIGNKLICSNIGDSRAIIVTEVHEKDESKFSFVPIQLTIDHKPNEKDERKRIEAMGGVVSSEGESIYRVYFKDEKLPGIAMSRSFGDEEAKNIGVSSEPEIFIRDICKEDRYIVVASDGVWEFLDNRAIEQIVSPFYLNNDPQGALNAIIAKATQAWNQENCTQDDITVIVAFLNKESSSINI